jgi:uncharacterized protein YndB with AHSA1/START domain
MEQKTNVIAEDGRQELYITRIFDLPLDLLFKAYSEPEILEQWMGTKVIKLENKNHGGFEFETSYNGKVAFKANGTIHCFEPNQRIVRTFEMENMPMGIQLEFLEFEKLSNDTSKLTIQIIYKSEKHRAEQLKLPFNYGINKAHDSLQEIFNNLK